MVSAGAHVGMAVGHDSRLVGELRSPGDQGTKGAQARVVFFLKIRELSKGPACGLFCFEYGAPYICGGTAARVLGRLVGGPSNHPGRLGEVEVSRDDAGRHTI